MEEFQGDQLPSSSVYPPTHLAPTSVPGSPAYPSADSAAPPPPPPLASYTYGYRPDWHAPPVTQTGRHRRGWTVPLVMVGVGVVVALLVSGGAAAIFSLSRNGSGQLSHVNGPVGSPPAGQPTSPSTSGGGQPSQPTSIPTTSPTGTHHVGDTVVVDGWQVVVNGVKTSSGGTFDDLKPGDIFLEIDVSVTNQTGQSQFFSDLEAFSLKDPTGQTYEQTFVSDAPAAPSGRVAAGDRLRGTVVYEVPATTHTFTLDATPTILSSNAHVAIWMLTV